MSGGTLIAPLTVTAAGAQPTPLSTIRQQLVNLISATNPGYTANLPASLIEDLVSTMAAGLSEMNQTAVESVNSLTPFLANPFTLTQLGNLLGVLLALSTNTSVSVMFTATASGQAQPGVVIPKGFTVSDGTNQYIVRDGGITGSNGQTPSLFCLCAIVGSFTVAPNTVTQLVTQAPPGIALTVTNPLAGTPSVGAQTQGAYAAQVFQAMLAASQGMSRYLKTLLANVSGVQSRLLSVRQQTGGGWEVVCGGGDPYQVAYAIYAALFDISTLVGSIISITSVTLGNPTRYTTNLNHGLINGQVVDISTAVPPIYNVAGTAQTATVLGQTAFTLPINSSAYTAAYVGSGVMTPNNRNVSVNVLDYPDTYTVPFVNPPQQTVTMAVTWNTTSGNVISNESIAQLAAPALAAYVNSLAVGAPMNLYVLQSTFQNAVASILPQAQITRLVFAVSINGVGVSPQAGTGIISGDTESYFFALASGITIAQG
jgi:hypothetical protein